MSDEEADMAPVQNAAAHFSGNIMNFERPKFNARQGNFLEALKALKKSVDISSKEASSTYLRKESVYWYKIGSDRKARRFMIV